MHVCRAKFLPATGIEALAQVRTTDVSAVKHHILQHLPVFQYNVGGVRPTLPSVSACSMHT